MKKPHALGVKKRGIFVSSTKSPRFFSHCTYIAQSFRNSWSGTFCRWQRGWAWPAAPWAIQGPRVRAQGRARPVHKRAKQLPQRQWTRFFEIKVKGFLVTEFGFAQERMLWRWYHDGQILWCKDNTSKYRSRPKDVEVQRCWTIRILRCTVVKVLR
jgi:hypothetical protein